MAEPERKPQTVNDRLTADGLRNRAVAIDPPTEGAIGIHELLRRFEAFAAADELLDQHDDGAAGVRELLARLANLADAGYFSSHDPDSSKSE